MRHGNTQHFFTPEPQDVVFLVYNSTYNTGYLVLRGPGIPLLAWTARFRPQQQCVETSPKRAKHFLPLPPGPGMEYSLQNLSHSASRSTQYAPTQERLEQHHYATCTRGTRTSASAPSAAPRRPPPIQAYLRRRPRPAS